MNFDFSEKTKGLQRRMQAFMDEFQIGTRAPQGTEVKMVKYVARNSQEGGFQ